MPGTAAPSRRRTSVPAPAAHTRSTADTDVLATLDVAAPPVTASTATISAPRDRSLLLGWRAWLFVAALVCAYTLPGVLGHDPWKQDETYTFGIIQHMLETGDFVVPTNAGLPFMEKPPLYAWVGTSLAWLLQRVMPLHDAARLASALFAALAFGFIARAARVASRADTWFDLRVLGPVVLSAGTLVVIKHVHDMMTDVALFAGTAIGFCGLLELVMQHVAQAQQMRHGLPIHPASRWAAPIFGAGVGIALMAKGLFVPLVFAATLVCTLVLYPACRTRSFARALGVAALVFAPFALIWPTALFLRSETLFMTWFWDNNVGRFFGFSVPELGAENDKPFFILRAFLTVGFPVAPLAIVALARGAWRDWRAPRIALPVLFAGIGLVVLQVSATSRQLYILPFFAPLALVAAQAIERLPRRLHLAWDYLSRILFGTVVVLAWAIWAVMADPAASRADLALLGRWLPLDWTMPIQPALVTGALALTVGWLTLLPKLRTTGLWRGALSWGAGAIVAWGLIYTLLLPWLDVAKSYRSVFDDLNAHLALEWNDGDCMASLHGLGESEAPMLYYFSGIEHTPIDDAKTTRCTWMIVQGVRAVDPAPGSEWKLFWAGARPGDNEELLRVYVRTPEQHLQ
ncbi:glycosyl transferase [Burkholderia cenocepacia]|uniref:ArnT family glycosyltransferase n=1 Tax=Burkholderia cenocepacia TaxID=95486 RepID=UPI001F2B5D16|nr:glycosyl transferase [Burkholderia cenocepacia]ELK7722406.1 glycosyl transferase [Burkholderia cenocepacia]MCF1367209.1 glycosyl transferase [Burkholderia cenocepacia]MCF1384742.1 glycosyl transferase [Burkholderia cenocepacia]